MVEMSTLSAVTGDSFKSFKLRLFSNNELASFTIVFDLVVVVVVVGSFFLRTQTLAAIPLS